MQPVDDFDILDWHVIDETTPLQAAGVKRRAVQTPPTTSPVQEVQSKIQPWHKAIVAVGALAGLAYVYND